jgi:hypothetical protein
MNEILEALQGVVLTEPEPEFQSNPAQPDDAAIETQLTQEISALWSDHVRLSANHKTTAKELRQLRAALAERLYAVKNLLARPGRGGEWRGWLRERAIPRSTADRLVSRHAENLGNENRNVLSGAISEGEDTVEQMVQSLLPRLKRTLPDTQAVFKFIAAVGEAFGLSAETTEDCLMLSQPKTVQSEDSPSATGAAEAVPAQMQSPGQEDSSGGIAVQAGTAKANGGNE